MLELAQIVDGTASIISDKRSSLLLQHLSLPGLDLHTDVLGDKSCSLFWWYIQGLAYGTNYVWNHKYNKWQMF